jgi:hypothetical protein
MSCAPDRQLRGRWFLDGGGQPAPRRVRARAHGQILSVHYHRDPDRRGVLPDEVARRRTPGFGIDDGAGILTGAGRVRVALSGREDAAVWRVVPDARGRASESRIVPVSLPSPRPAIDEAPDAVIEMGALRRAAPRREAWSRR